VVRDEKRRYIFAYSFYLQRCVFCSLRRAVEAVKNLKKRTVSRANRMSQKGAATREVIASAASNIMFGDDEDKKSGAAAKKADERKPLDSKK
jgi:hypothetical protein